VSARAGSACSDPGPSCSRRTLLDDVLPRWHFGNHHAVVVAAPPAAVLAAAERWSPATDAPAAMRLLFRLRGFTPGTPGRGLRDALGGEGFAVVAERPGAEIVLGIAGRFWALHEPAGIRRIADGDAFRAFAEPGTAKGAMSLRVEPLPGGRTRLATETRVLCLDAAAYRRFAPYWMLIRPFSGWIRGVMLRGIARRALAMP